MLVFSAVIFKCHFDWIAAPTPLCLGPDQTSCDISRRFPRCRVFFEIDESQKTVRISYFQSWFPLVGLSFLADCTWGQPWNNVMSPELRWDVGAQTLVCPVRLQSATFLCTSCFSQSQGLGLVLVPVVSRWKTVLPGYTFTAWPQDQWLKWMAD